MTTSVLVTEPKFSKNQPVCFVGGVGRILSCQLEYNTWAYIIEMEMGPEPSMGRIGAETSILLHENDILNVLN